MAEWMAEEADRLEEEVLALEAEYRRKARRADDIQGDRSEELTELRELRWKILHRLTQIGNLRAGRRV